MQVHRSDDPEDGVDIDALTGALTRQEILDTLDRQLAREAHSVAVLFIDVDELKSVNDAYGHAAGDELIAATAGRLRAALRDDQFVGRLGGDEFLVVATKSTEACVVSLAQRMLEDCQMPLSISGIEVRPRVSIGLALGNADTTADDLVADADMAMYEAKRRRSGVVVASDASRLRMRRSVAVNTELAQAMATRQIQFAYQPVVDLVSGEVLGAEALIRWNHPTFGLIPPPLIFERAEASGQINELTEWSLEAVCSEWADLRRRRALFVDKAVSVNMTARQLSWPDYADVHYDALDTHGLRPVDLIVEIVESGVIDVDDAAESTVKTITSRGTIVALDDFGVGYNSLGYFTRMPIHAVKVDRTLVAAGTKDPVARIVLSSVFDMGKNLGVHLVGEGIETQAELEMCRDLGITVGQGYLLQRPMLMADLEVAMEANWREWERRKGLL